MPEQDNDTIVKTDSQDVEVEKEEPSSSVEDKIDSEGQLKTEESKPVEPPTVEPTKTTGENLKTHFSVVMEHRNLFLIMHKCLLHHACSVIKCIFLQTKIPNCLIILKRKFHHGFHQRLLFVLYKLHIAYFKY